MKAKELHKRLNLDVSRIEAKKEDCPLGTQGYVALCLQQGDVLLKCLHNIYWCAYD
jgi:hypothetical protein